SHRQRRQIDFHYDLAFPDGAVAFNLENSDTDEVRTARRLAAGEVSLDALDDGLARFAAVAREAGFQAIVAYSPSAYTAYEHGARFRDPSLEPTMRSYSRLLREHVRDASEKLGLTFVDLTPALQAAADKERGKALLYGPAHLHFTSEGSTVAAEALSARLAA